MPRSATADLLLDMIRRGGSNVQSAAEIARAVKSDCGHSLPALDAIASCGANGANSNNTERDLHRFLRGARGLKLEKYNITLQLQACSF